MMMKKILSALLISAVLLWSGTVFTEHANAESKQTEKKLNKDTKEEYKLETMTVTAQKKEENVQDVPMSISVFSDIQLEDAGINNIEEVIRFTPNVYRKGSIMEHALVIRGISSFDTSMFSPAGVYVNDISLPIHYMYNADLYDIERIEVLKGPQGTLYGRNTESGVINIITKQPDNELRGKIFGEYANYNSFRTGGSISGPIVRDKLYLGLAGQWKDSDGYMENEFNSDDKAGKTDHKSGRATLRWTPADAWDLSLIVDAMKNDDNTGLIRYETGPLKSDPYKTSLNGEYFTNQEENGQTFRLKYKGDSFNVLSVTGLRYFENDYAMDVDVSADPIFDFGTNFFLYEDRLMSEEIRVTSPEDSGQFQWLVGVYGFNEKTDIDFDNPTNPMMGGPRTTDIDTTGHAVFGQGTYTFFSKLHLTAGLRYDHEKIDGKQKAPGADFAKDLDFNELLPKLAVGYDFTNDIMAYASASKGYFSGGFNYLASDLESFSYDLEYTRNYEIGIKTTWLNNMLMANLSAFYIDMKDKQVSEANPLHQIIVKNAAEAHSQGLELEVQARPMQGLDFFAGFGYTEAKFDKWTATESDFTTMPPSFVQYDYKDKNLQNVPEITYNLGAQYRHESGFFGRVDLFGVGKHYYDCKNTLKDDGYELVNMSFGYEAESFDVKLWCKNVFDEEYIVQAYDWGGSKLVQDGEPRMLGVTVTYRF